MWHVENRLLHGYLWGGVVWGLDSGLPGRMVGCRVNNLPITS